MNRNIMQAFKNEEETTKEIYKLGLDKELLTSKSMIIASKEF